MDASHVMSKEDAGRDLPHLHRSIEDMCRKWNREDGIVGLLCLEDAYDDLANSLLPKVSLSVEAGGLPEHLKFPLFRHLSQRFVVIDFALELIVNLGEPGPRTIRRIPSLEISLAAIDTEEDLRKLYDSLVLNGKIGPDDAAIPGTARLMGKYEIGWIIRVEGCKGKIEARVIDRLLDLTDLVSKNFVYLSAIRTGASLTMTPGVIVPYVNYPASMTPEAIMAMERMGPRTMFQSGISPAEWTSSFSEALAKSVPTLAFGIDSPSSRQAMERENEEFFRGFTAYPGFADLFENEFGYSLSTFQRVTSALQRMSIPRVHQVYIDNYDRILRKASKISAVSIDEARKVVESFLWSRGRIFEHFPVIELKSSHAFSMVRIRGELVSRVEGCFQMYDNNSKGEKFEVFCRNIILEHKFAVHPSRFEVADQVLSDEDSFRIWGKIKKGTDFDVLGTRGIYLLVLECKERKWHTTRWTHLKNMTARYSQEHVLKCCWLAQNIDRLAGSPCVTAPSSPRFVLPVLVYNRPIDEFDSPPNFVTSKELATLVDAADFSSVPNADLYEVAFPQGFKVKLPSIPIRKADDSFSGQGST